jgi:hypothetical protein
MTEFVKGMKVSTVETKYGEIIKLGIKIDEFKQNPVNERGYLNIDILTSQKGTKYAVLNSYKKQEKYATSETIQDEFEGQIVDFADEEINF